ncbi:MAG: hypothetical protein M1818_006968 [Claussenomyces sp. TS43310]|nr:MAG: hypothetical protein M1818_006968 [Claussenomyces sp. TS43310]
MLRSIQNLLLLLPLSLSVHTVQATASGPPLQTRQSSGCGSALPGNQTVNSVTNVLLEYGGRERSYLIFIPPKYDINTPSALIVSYHGGTQTAEDQLELDQFTNPEFNTDIMVAYPQGIDDVWQGVPGVSVDDLGFTNALLDAIESHHCISTSKIFAAGKSDGGGFVNQLACNATLSMRLAAFAAVSGAFYINTTACDDPSTVHIPCAPGRDDVPIIEFHGGNDTTIPYTGGAHRGECLPAIPHWVHEWADRDGLSLDNTTTRLEKDTWEYTYGQDGLVTHVYDESIGHDWPSTVPNHDNQQSGHHPASFNATPIILEYFGNHTL